MHLNELGSFFYNEKGDYFKEPPVFRSKQIGNSQCYSIRTYKERIYLKTDNKAKDNIGEDPYIEFKELWSENSKVEYRYKFAIPNYKYLIDVENSGRNTKLSEYSFRYEIHLNNTSHWPIHHLHILDGVPPSYEVHNHIGFRDFFRIIEDNFCENKTISFKKIISEY